MFERIIQYYDESRSTFKFLLWILYTVSTIAVAWAIWVVLVPVTIWYLETFSSLYCN
jgi:hypothetical protein